MASNYSSDPRNILPVEGSAASQNQGGLLSEIPEALPVSDEGRLFSSPSTNGGNMNVSGPKRLPVGSPLSGARYTIESLVAQGGMGAVYRAVDTRFDGPCAVKEMLDEFRDESQRADAVKWFEREAKLLLKLNHQCIPRVRDFFAEDGKNYLVMDFIDGYTLAQMLELEGNVKGLSGASGITEARARSWTRQICSVLSYLHHLNPPIIFRDLKPANIMITKQDEIKLIDFGIARVVQAPTQQATVIMTIGYAPPEQLQGKPEPRSDLYSLGATLHRLLTRHDPANNKGSMFAFPSIRSLRPDVSPAFDQIVMRALEQHLEQRWPSAEDMERAVINLPPLAATPPLLQFAVNSPNFPVQRPPSGAQPGSISGPSSQPSAPTTHTTTHRTTRSFCRRPSLRFPA